jgi:hypothetical protein
MITGETRAAAARLFFQASDLAANEQLRVCAGELRAIIDAFWFETKRADKAEGRLNAAQADCRLGNLLGTGEP